MGVNVRTKMFLLKAAGLMILYVTVTSAAQCGENERLDRGTCKRCPRCHGGMFQNTTVSDRPSICMSVCLSVCLPIYLSVCANCLVVILYQSNTYLYTDLYRQTCKSQFGIKLSDLTLPDDSLSPSQTSPPYFLL